MQDQFPVTNKGFRNENGDKISLNLQFQKKTQKKYLETKEYHLIWFNVNVDELFTKSN